MKIYEKLGLDRCDLNSVYHNKTLSQQEFYNLILNETRDSYKVLDAGAGEGKLKNIFIDKSIEYCGVDLGVGHKDWDFSDMIEGDLENLHFIKDNEMDMVLLIQVLEHLQHPHIVLKELNRVLKENHKIFIAVPQAQGVHQVPYDYFRFTPYGLRSLLEEAGFVVESINPQLYGDLQVNIKKVISTLEYYMEESKGVKKLLLKLLYFKMRFLNKIAKYFDKDIKRYVSPIGYFVAARKKVQNG